MTRSSDYWIKHLELKPHPEGGYFKETYRADMSANKRSASTGIYFLIESGNVSRFHRIDADEMWHFYEGNALIVHMIAPNGNYSFKRIGNNPDKGDVFQAVVPAGYWFGAEVSDGGKFSLVGCTVAPGFEFSGFELANKAKLLNEFPDHTKVINRLT